MKQTAKFQVSLLWQGDKGTGRAQFSYFPVSSLALDGYGVWFALTSSYELWLCNAQHDELIYINMHAKQYDVFQNPLSPSFRLVGGFGQNGHLVVLATYSRRKQLPLVATLGRGAEVLSALELKTDVPLPPPVWFRPFQESYLCFHRGFDLKGLVVKGQLLQYSATTGALVRTVDDVSGVAIGSENNLYYLCDECSANVRMLPMVYPKMLEPNRWLLLGCDRRGHSYWYTETRRGRWRESHVACADSHGAILWESPLTGSKGILAEVDSHLQVHLGWGGEWIEVLPAGDILVFAWSGSKKVRGGVGIYRVNWTESSSSNQ